VGPENVVVVKPVTLGPEAEGLRVVRSGITADDEIIINGIVNARPGSKVNPQQGDMNQFKNNQLQLQTNAKAEPVGDTKEKSNQPKPGGGH
jgi:hypothetical protein